MREGDAARARPEGDLGPDRGVSEEIVERPAAVTACRLRARFLASRRRHATSVAGGGIVTEIGDADGDSYNLWTVGVKAGYKKILFGRERGISHSRGVLESYVSVGYTSYFGEHRMGIADEPAEHVVWLNAGFRFVIEC